jgi:putative membrane protein
MKWTGLTALACGMALTVACAGNGRDDRMPDDDRSSAELRSADEPGAVGTSGEQQAHGATADARHFAEQAAYAGNAEVKLGQLAAERAESPAVKEFAQMMVRDHSKAGGELKQAVAKHDVETPTGLDAEHQQLFDRLSRLRGADFDREYMKAMVDGHEKVKSMLADRTRSDRAAANRNRPTGTAGTSGDSTPLDMAVTQWASKSLPRVEQHLEKAKQVRDGDAAHSGARH